MIKTTKELEDELAFLRAHVQSQRKLMDELNWYANDADLYKDQQRIAEIKKILKDAGTDQPITN